MAHTGRYVHEAEQQLEEWRVGLLTTEWQEIQARLLAYASQPVLEALQASEYAIGWFRDRFQNWKWMRDNVDTDPEGPTASDVRSARRGHQTGNGRGKQEGRGSSRSHTR